MIKVRSIMTSDVITITQEPSILEAAKLMLSKNVSSLVVVDKGKPVGIVSEIDIMRGVISKNKKIRDIMEHNFMEISPTTNFLDVSRKLRNSKIRRFAVMENGKLVGLITETDIVEATRDFTRADQIVQEVILGIFGLATAFFLFYASPLGASLFR